MYELLTTEDKNMITHYIEANAGFLEADLEYILHFWDEAKSGYLKKLFKDQFIISTPISYSESLEDIMDHIDTYIYRDDRCVLFIDDFKNHFKIGDWDEWQTPACQNYQNISCLLNYKALATNRLPYDLKINDWKFAKGTKTARVIAKIAKDLKIGITPDANGITDLEYFRRRHSLALNTKKLFGKLCLSIHPLDYMTMSDNSNGWSSCMSWEEEGEYRMGTVEMMNSPCIVVAYLASEDDTFPIAGYNWNSKKWRSLFIVDPNFIANIKGYPYQNDSLTKEAMKTLADLADWLPQEPTKYSVYTDNEDESYINDKLVKLYFHTNNMYNDFGSTTSFLLINPSYTDSKLVNTDYNYSGEAECMKCGDTYVNREDTLVGTCCDNTEKCEYCGDYYESEDLITLGDGTRVCECCYDEETATDAITGEQYLYNDLTCIWLYSEDETEYVKPNPIYLYNTKSFLNPTYTTLEGLQLNEFSYEYYVKPSELTPEGLELFGAN